MRTGQFVFREVPEGIVEEAARFAGSDGRVRLIVTNGETWRIMAGSTLAEGETVAGVVAAYAEDDAAPLIELEDGEGRA